MGAPGPIIVADPVAPSSPRFCCRAIVPVTLPLKVIAPLPRALTTLTASRNAQSLPRRCHHRDPSLSSQRMMDSHFASDRPATRRRRCRWHRWRWQHLDYQPASCCRVGRLLGQNCCLGRWLGCPPSVRLSQWRLRCSAVRGGRSQDRC